LVIVTETKREYFNHPEYDAVQIRSWVPLYQSAMHHIPEYWITRIFTSTAVVIWNTGRHVAFSVRKELLFFNL